MISEKSALKILNKYGYKSKDSKPYLYKNNKEIGINYSYIDSKYGITDRVISFRNDSDLELFLKKYQWYKLNGKKYNVTLRLNNYEIASPEVLYIRDNHVMTDDEILNISGYDKTKRQNKKLTHTKRMLVEAQNLMQYYYSEKEKEEKFSNNFINKENELRRYYLDLQMLVDKYNKKNTNIDLTELVKDFEMSQNIESNIDQLLEKFQEKLPEEEKLKKLILNIWDLNKELELNELYMKALRYNDDTDEELRLVTTKIDYMKELLGKRRSIFNIVDLKSAFDKIDKQSTYESIYDDNFEDKYKEFIINKYDVLDKINEFRLCEYLNNFKTNKSYDIKKNIERCKDEEEKKKSEYKTFEEVAKKLTKEFSDNLDEKEQAALTLYVSIYRELFEMIQKINDYENMHASDILALLKITDNYNSNYELCYLKMKEILSLSKNRLMKKKFKYINYETEELFIESLVNNLKIIANINKKMKLKDNIKLYFKVLDFNDFDKNKFIITSSIISPFMNYNCSKYKIISANVRKGINVLFSPRYITINDDKIEEINNLSEILIDTRDIKVDIDENTTIYTRFNYDLKKEEKYSYVNKYDINYKLHINKVVIEKREE